MTAPKLPRLPLVDALRGFAVAQMIVYHFIYDLNYFGWVTLAMTRDQPWVGWRTAIVTQFLLLVGASLVLRTAYKPTWRDFWERWAQIAGASALVSAGTWLVFGPRYVWFGILHFIAVALVLARPLVALGAWNLLLGAAAIGIGLFVKHAAFDPTPWSVVGLVTVKPRTEDYVPLLPWIGVVLIGVALGTLWRRHGFALAPALRRLNEAPPRWLVFLGVWSLTAYLVHQPVLMAMLWILRKFV
ncbi:MAG: hypothetical protein OHK0044_33170 [Burkholderiaceae bacterium]